jgi:hypothetical protein
MIILEITCFKTYNERFRKKCKIQYINKLNIYTIKLKNLNFRNFNRIIKIKKIKNPAINILRSFKIHNNRMIKTRKNNKINFDQNDHIINRFILVGINKSQFKVKKTSNTY